MTAAMTENPLVRRNESPLTMRGGAPSAMAIEQARARRDTMVQFVRDIMVRDVDYGIIPGTDKPTLLKPGAEKLATFFGLATILTIVEKIEDWSGEQHGSECLFYYVARCQLYCDEALIAESVGSCNSRESKFRWRWVPERELPHHLNKDRLANRSGGLREPAFAVKNKETGGKYGKPMSHWDRFEKAIADGTAKKVTTERDGGKKMDWWEIGETLYRVPNEDIASQINTLQKQAQKRALVGTVLIGVNASEYFTQDLDELEERAAKQAENAADDAQPPANDDDQRPPAEIFNEKWHKAIEARGLPTNKANSVLGAILQKKNKTLDNAHPVFLQELLDAVSAGKFDGPLKGEKTAQPVSEEPAANNDGIDAASFEAFKIGLWQAAEAMDSSEADFKSAIQAWLLRLGKKGKEESTTQEQRKALSDALASKSGYFSYLDRKEEKQSKRV